MGNNKKRALCRPCYEARKNAGEKLKLVKAGKDNKIVCADCGRKRFGAEYE